MGLVLGARLPRRRRWPPSAGLMRAAGIIAAFKDDSRNMLITMQARFANSEVKIGAHCSQNNLIDQLY